MQFVLFNYQAFNTKSAQLQTSFVILEKISYVYGWQEASIPSKTSMSIMSKIECSNYLGLFLAAVGKS